MNIKPDDQQQVVYLLTFSCGAWYVGQTSELSRRWSHHKSRLHEGTAAKTVQRVYEANGDRLPTLDIIVTCDDKDERLRIEDAYLSERYMSEPHLCLNDRWVSRKG